MRQRREADQRAGDEHSAAAAPREVRRIEPAEPCDRRHVELQHLIEHIGRLLGERPRPRAASVGDEELNLAPERGRGRVQRLGRLGTRQAQRHHLCLRAVLSLEGRRQFGERSGAARHQDHVAAALGGFGGEGVANSAGGTGDDGPRPIRGRAG